MQTSPPHPQSAEDNDVGYDDNVSKLNDHDQGDDDGDDSPSSSDGPQYKFSSDGSSHSSDYSDSSDQEEGEHEIEEGVYD